MTTRKYIQEVIDNETADDNISYHWTDETKSSYTREEEINEEILDTKEFKRDYENKKIYIF